MREPGWVQRESELVVRDLVGDDFPVARRIIATAFANEPFTVGMFGESLLDRFVGLTEQYASWPWTSNAVVVGAEAHGNVVGVALATLPGECHLCKGFDETVDPQSTKAEQIEHEFQLACRNAHLNEGLPPHAHIVSVATDPLLHGCGIGRRVVDEVVARIWSSGAQCAVLECLTTREAFYTGAGFRRLVEFVDPGGPGLRSVLMRIDAP